MAWTITSDLAEHLAVAGELLSSRPAEHTMLLTQLERLRLADAAGTRSLPAQLAAWRDRDDGPVTGVAVQLPRGPLGLGTMPTEAAAVLAGVLEAPLQEVVGSEPAAAAFAEAWSARTGQAVVRDRVDALMRLGTLEEPIPPAGRAVVASFTDRPLCIELVHGFFREVADAGGAADTAGAVDDRLAHGGLTLWYDEQGTPSAIAGLNRLVAGAARIGPVFTPPGRRGHGFAGAVTAAVARQALAAGAEQVLLFADTANATSTGLYERLGFERLGHKLVLRFVPAGAGEA